MSIEPTTRRARSPGIVGAAAMLATLCITALPAAAEGLGRCATAPVPGPVILPDGSVYELHRLTLCVKHRGAVVGYHEIRLDGMNRYMLESRIGFSEGPPLSDRPIIVFEPTPDGRWRLIGYTWPGRENSRTYALTGIGQAAGGQDAGRWAALEPERDEYVQVVANFVLTK